MQFKFIPTITFYPNRVFYYMIKISNFITKIFSALGKMSRFERVKQWTAFSRTWHIYDAKWQNPFHSAKVTTELFFSFIHFPFSFFADFLPLIIYRFPFIIRRSLLSLFKDFISLFVEFLSLLFVHPSSHYSQI
jgi:hypothetical protein